MSLNFKENDFLKIGYDLYANGVIQGTTDKEKAEKEKIPLEENKILVLGKNKFLKKLDEDILKNYKEGKRELILNPDDAFGKRKKELLQTYNKTIFIKNKLKPVVGGVYNFDGMLGIVKSVTGGRVLIDFNHPLAGKEIKIVYKVIEKIDDDFKKLDVYLSEVLKLNNSFYEIKNEILYLSEELKEIYEIIKDGIKEYIPTLKNLKIEFKKFKNNKNEKHSKIN